MRFARSALRRLRDGVRASEAAGAVSGRGGRDAEPVGVPVHGEGGARNSGKRAGGWGTVASRLHGGC